MNERYSDDKPPANRGYGYDYTTLRDVRSQRSTNRLTPEQAHNRALIPAPRGQDNNTRTSPGLKRCAPSPERPPHRNKQARVDDEGDPRDQPNYAGGTAMSFKSDVSDDEYDVRAPPLPPLLHDNGLPNVWDRVDAVTTTLPEERAFALLRFLEDANDDDWARMSLRAQGERMDGLSRYGSQNTNGVWVEGNRAVTININHTSK